MMTTNKVAALQEGDVIRHNGEEYIVTGTEWRGRHDLWVYVCNEQATDWRLPLLPGDKVEVVRYRPGMGVSFCPITDDEEDE